MRLEYYKGDDVIDLRTLIQDGYVLTSTCMDISVYTKTWKYASEEYMHKVIVREVLIED